MTPSLMDTGDERYSPSSLSAEDCNSNTAGSEREGEGQQVGNTGMKRRAKNRDAARRTRRKQTERADELHEELQCLEQANSAFQKEIAALKKDFHHYTDILAHHEPYCLKASASTKGSTVSSLGGDQTNPIPPPNLPRASSSILAPPPLVSNLLQTLDCVKNAHLAPTVTTLLSMTELPSSSSPPIPISTLSPPHSLFSKASVTPRPTDVTPVFSRRLSTSMTSSILTTAAQPRSDPDVIHNTSAAPANACFPTFDSGSLDEILSSQTASLTASSSCPLNVPQLHSSLYSGDPNMAHPLCTLLTQSLQSPTVSVQANLEQAPVPAFAVKPCYRQMTPSPASLLSLLTVPSPLNASQTTSSSDGLLVEPPPSLPSLDEPSTDLSLSEFLDVNEWILSGAINH